MSLFHYFDLQGVANPGVRIVDATTFATHPDLAPSHWPVGTRKLYHGRSGRNPNLERDSARMWASVGLELPPAYAPQTAEAADAAGSHLLKLSYQHATELLTRALPADEHPVVLLPTTPGPYPAADTDWDNQRYVRRGEPRGRHRRSMV